MSISTVSTGAAARRNTSGIIALLAGLAALSALSTNIILPSFPSIATELRVSTRDLGVTLSFFFFAFALGQLIVGPVSDRIGRKPVVLSCLIIFAVGSAIGAEAGSMSVLVAARIVQALGACAASVLSRAVARDLFEGNELARVLSFTMVAMAAAPGFSPLLGTAIDTMFGWRIAFLMVGIIGLIVGLAYTWSVGETLPANMRPRTSFGSVARGYAGLLVTRQFIFPALCVSFIIGALYAFFAATPAILLEGMGMSKLGMSLFFAATVFVVFGSGMIAPRLARRFGMAQAILAGAVVSAAGNALLLAGGETPSFEWFAFSRVVFLLGMGIANPLGTAMTLQPFGHQAGLASAMLGFLQMACAAAATTIVTLLPLPTALALAVVLFASTALALVAFLFRETESKS